VAVLARLPSQAPLTRPRRNLCRRLNYEAHLWLGLLTTGLVLVVHVTGIVLNHKRAFGVMNEPDHTPGATLSATLPLEQLVWLAVRAFNHPDYSDETSINHMDFRPNKGYIKVRFRDPQNIEVILDVVTGSVLSVGPRGDVFWEQPSLRRTVRRPLDHLERHRSGCADRAGPQRHLHLDVSAAEPAGASP
jgi:uncharacterized iron-regulated membrane protein